MRVITLIALVAVVIAACNNTQTAQETEGVNELAEDLGDGFYGEKFEIEQVYTMEMLDWELSNKELVDTLRGIVIEAEIQDVCKKKGCWMTVKYQAPMRVTFKDYGFFMPFDIPGKTVHIKGDAFYEVVDVETLKHFAEDEGKTQEEIDAITEPQEEMRFVATGVHIP